MGTAARIALPDRYEVRHHIASGGMASVWAADDRLLGRLVAVKLLADHLAGDPGSQARFTREARAAARVSDHPHVVTIYDVGEHDGSAFMVMEHLAGGTVADRLRGDERIPVSQARRWLLEAASALDAAHAHGIVHRDVKPANLLLDERDRLAVGDFGIARLAADAAVTQTGVVLGTAAYLSPEQAVGGAASEASDRYALAVVAYELLTGRRPFRAEHAAAQARQHVETPPPSASRELPGLPPAVDEVLRRGMAKEPAGRPPCACAFAEDLEAALGGFEHDLDEATAPTTIVRPPGAVRGPDGTRRRTPTPPPLTEAPVAPARGATGRERRRRLAGVAAGLVVALLVAGGAVALSGGGSGEPAGVTDEPPAAPRDGESPPGGSGGQPPSGGEAGGAATARGGDGGDATARGGSARGADGQDSTGGPGADALAGLSPGAANDRGFRLFRAGRYAAAIPYFRRSVEGYEAAGDTGGLPYAYALYNLGASLNRAGDPAAAIPVLERRLEVSDNQAGTVRAELADARAKLDGGGRDAADGDDDEGRGAGRGKDKGDRGRGRGDD